MAIFNPASSAKRDTPTPPETALGRQPGSDEISFPPHGAAPAATPAPSPVAAAREAKESVIASDIAIEGRIQGAGHVRIAGRFTGDIAVEGDLTIEVGARVNGGVRAQRVVVAGELEGNIEAAQRVEVVASGSMVGDVKAGTVTVAPGARMRGMVEFGWDGDAARKSGKANGTPEAGGTA
ncbi:polymer-forming cytoskeletal protein [Lysobacter sp. N42]|jgi:cytoskeletal protein CcmA (bactofilin family)|uniref:bactofilin family protein n=1 Tax=Lysobacter sp. N42 TaxID=2545719 RepID=UPI0010488708|nr:polymer-forming cytoskeletal protein [Lysobacter sp. N42]